MKNTSHFLVVRNVSKIFTAGSLLSRIKIPAVWNVSFILEDEPFIFTIVGESGSGKTTLANVLLRILKPTSGEIFLQGKKLEEYSKFDFLKRVQPIFQNPYEAFNPLKKVETYLLSSVRKFSDKKKDEVRVVDEVLNAVGLSWEQVKGKFPHEFSGGQLQRIAIARALLVNPVLLIADEPVSMLDVSLRVSILNLFRRLKENFNKKIIYITHDLATAYYISDYLAVMLRGSIVEFGPAEKILVSPMHPYTKLLRTSVPELALEESEKSNIAVSEKKKMEVEEYTLTGCKFFYRCLESMERCLKEEPKVFQVDGREVKCWLYEKA